ncbi:MAG: thiamine phosphate synthase [Ruminococcus sp.]|uniref:thiamine phosphate synthase n=1 Tax=Ruminococcus sp. TaxID=41978 RepID=UPI0025D4483A|nr:thiamine phosphate synthase [Ruminococcus sp.]MCR5601101.1 thiamine phosphate synthase [Ruminococcus sp.]
MSDIVCITARKLCCGDFFEQLGRIAEAEPRYIVLREKDLDEAQYRELAKKSVEKCNGHGTKLVLHYYWKVAAELGADSIHLPLHILREMSAEDKAGFSLIGTSCHSVDDALEAQSLGADYITAGHVFATDCKKGLPPRGLDFLRDVCYSVDIPVYAIGGISPDNIASVRECGAAGACIMSGFMKCLSPKAYMGEFNGK